MFHTGIKSPKARCWLLLQKMIDLLSMEFLHIALQSLHYWCVYHDCMYTVYSEFHMNKQAFEPWRRQ